MRKTRTRETAITEARPSCHAAEARAYARVCKARASPHAAEMPASSHAAEMPASSHPTTMHAASHTSSHPATMAPTATAATMAATATTTPARERRWRQSKRRTERNRDQATKSLVVHPDYSVLNRSDGHRRKKTVRRAKLSNDFK
jgi:hypothetical protein